MKYQLLLTMIFLLLLISNSYLYSSSEIPGLCKCVAFRLDDVQDYYLDNVNKQIIKTFQEKNASLTVGIVGNLFGHDQSLISFIRNRLNNDSPELAIANHGWNHEDFRRFSKDNQSLLITRTNEKLNQSLGVSPTVFIAPFDVFNNGTYWVGINHDITVDQIQNSILKHGFAVVEIHPYEYSSKHDYSYKPFNATDPKGTFSYKEFIKNWDKAKIDWKQIKELQSLLGEVQEKGYKIVTIQNLT